MFTFQIFKIATSPVLLFIVLCYCEIGSTGLELNLLILLGIPFAIIKFQKIGGPWTWPFSVIRSRINNDPRYRIPLLR